MPAPVALRDILGAMAFQSNEVNHPRLKSESFKAWG
jgi:hypothetical protein